MAWHGPPLPEGLAFYGAIGTTISVDQMTHTPKVQFVTSAAPSAAEGVEMSEIKIEVGQVWESRNRKGMRWRVLAANSEWCDFSVVYSDGHCADYVFSRRSLSELPLNCTLVDAERDGTTLKEPERTPIPEPIKTSAHSCIRCGGPAYVGLLSVACERVGGCKTDAAAIGEPVVTESWFVPDGSAYQATGDSNVTAVREAASERLWQATGCNVTRRHPVKEEAVTAWRKAVLAGER
jgi:hypothetical protein